ncbi:hypothetical protein HOLleu_27438 [Holothuria leucospilota]|uniref:Reverse transcriptase RNase H-like domain-containing protein n=1 Tax=Holothuria leucospilota TaxID=206669 RepID=A0A9Q1BQE5_HOLLE|nr:hypothetical protein HOLleu_27438 [Holothuria leucospilota]
MGYPDFQKTSVHNNASCKGLGTVLYQEQGGKRRVISYASRSLTLAEKNYHMHSGKLEFLALKWAVTEQFRDYLYYAKYFTVYTDNYQLMNVLTNARLNATSQRWVAELVDFHFKIRYRPGRVNVDADSFSRSPLPHPITDLMEEYTEEVSPNVMSCVRETMDSLGKGETPWIESVCLNSEELKLPGLPLQENGQKTTISDLKVAHEEDEVISRVLYYKRQGTRPSARKGREEPREVSKMLLEWDKLALENERILRRQVGGKQQLKLLHIYHKLVFKELH